MKISLRALLLAVLIVAAMVPASAWAAPPSNDDRSNAAPITFGSSFDIDLTEATTEPDEVQPSCAGVERSVWFTMAAPHSFRLSIDLAGTVGSITGGAYRGDAPAWPGQCIEIPGSGSIFGMPLRPTRNLFLDAGERLWLQLGVPEGSEPTRLRVSFDEGGTVTGTISSGTGDPAVGICAVAVDNENRAVRLGRSDEIGLYLISGLPPDTYRIFFAECYAASTQNSSEPFPLAAGATESGVDGVVTLLPGAYGMVTDNLGLPVADVCVEFLHLGSDDSYPGLTDADGQYSLLVNTAASYDVRIRDCSGADRFPTFWYPDANERASGEQVTLGPEERRRLDIAVNLGGHGSIVGRVVNQRSVALADMCVELYNLHQQQVASALTNIIGWYRFDQVLQGPHRIRATDCAGTSYLETWVGGSSSFEDAAWVPVSADRTSRADELWMRHDPNGTTGAITGVVRDANGRGIEGLRVEALAGTALRGTAVTDAYGMYTISRLPDWPYSVRASGTADDGRTFHTKFYDGDAEIYAGTPVDGIDLWMVEQVHDAAVTTVVAGARPSLDRVQLVTTVRNAGTMPIETGLLTVEICPRTLGSCEELTAELTSIGPGSEAGIAVNWDASGYIGDALIKATVRIPRDADARNDVGRATSSALVGGLGVRAR